MVKTSKYAGVKHFIMASLIALVFVFFIAYAIQSVYPAPDYSDFCEDGKYGFPIGDRATCESEGGKWFEDESFSEPKESGDGLTPVRASGYCDIQFTCGTKYNTARDVYERNVFFVNLLFGVLAIALSLVLTVEVVSTGFLAGGAIMLVYGTIRYWGDLSSIFRTLFLAIALGVLIWIAYKKFAD